MIEVDIDEVLQRLDALGETWAEANALADELDEAKKIVLAQLTREHLETGSVAKAEVMALSDQVYKTHITALVEARRHANGAQIRYKNLLVWCDLFRTKQATMRAQIERLGG